jgi:hypothetical protein
MLTTAVTRRRTPPQYSTYCGEHPQVCATPSQDWAGFLSSYYQHLDGVNQYHHFCFKKNHSMVISIRNTAVVEEEDQVLLQDV